MKRANKLRLFAFGGFGLILTLAAGIQVAELMPGSTIQVISSAQARVGRPLTPVSYAGVARRTTRRAVAYGGAAMATTAVAGSVVANEYAPASSSMVASPPYNCPAEGAVFVCGGYSYHPVMQGSTVVYSVRPAN
ncbi:hypothetical protein [Pusillimonas sp. ANT_WB101]|uniref:hypothetical protein n=1 Tax=Pusillimonas sp. ANT_WB101 TaxID=2597356 RepID=UPI0011EE3CB5|nr:hypothetical protein [Pusillimonas sp. ANT_WB101]KAA0889956.1 hypothetical protein FQ179_16510 [Pusillimonas sp. ANT_WB101]